MSLREILKEQVKEIKEKVGDELDGLTGKAEGKLARAQGKVGEKLDQADNYLAEKAEAYGSMDPDKKKDLTKGLIGAAVTVVAPWYAAIPAGIYAWKKGKKIFGKKE